MNDKSFEKYFQNELGKLQGLAQEFSTAYPSVAPLLQAHNADPDAERLLEGVSFLTALLNQKLDNEFPEVVHELINVLFPHYLKPIPAFSILEFTPKVSLRERRNVPKGSIINSVPIENVACTFSTTSEIDFYPLELVGTHYESRSENVSSRLSLELNVNNTSPASLDLDALDFYLSDSYNEASNLFMLLSHYLQKITLTFNGKSIDLPVEMLISKGFERESSLLQYPSNAFSSYALLQEYFVLPQKFLFFRLEGLQKLQKYAGVKSFTVDFQFRPSLVQLETHEKEVIKLFCTPVCNLFDEEAEPITVTHEKELLHVRPPLKYADKCQVYDIKSISSYIQGGSRQKVYVPFESFEQDQQEKSIYQVHRKISIVTGKEELYLQLHYDDKEVIGKEVLSVKISCTNGALTERLQLGEISKGSDTSPEQATFRDIIPCTMQIDSPVSDNSLWQLISHLSVNLLSLSDIKTFKEMLRLYIFSNNRDKSRVAKNKKHIDAIERFEVHPMDMVKRGYLLKGHNVVMEVRQDYFASLGDLYLFCSVILRFLGSYTALNTFVALEVKEKITGERLRWEPILGNKKLL